jgi:hypothetical protein
VDVPIDLAPYAALSRTIPVGGPGKLPGAVIDHKL